MTGLTGFHCNLKLGCSRKYPHPPTDGIVEILVGGGGGGSKTLEIQVGVLLQGSF